MRASFLDPRTRAELDLHGAANVRLLSQVVFWAIAATIAGIVGVVISILQWVNAR